MKRALEPCERLRTALPRAVEGGKVLPPPDAHLQLGSGAGCAVGVPASGRVREGRREAPGWDTTAQVGFSMARSGFMVGRGGSQLSAEANPRTSSAEITHRLCPANLQWLIKRYLMVSETTGTDREEAALPEQTAERKAALLIMFISL